MSKITPLKMPETQADGFVRTLNQMGFMTSSLDPFSQAFVDYSGKVTGPVLEIGAAYGIATIEALKNGAQVIANDSDSRHLEILLDRTPLEDRSRLTLLPGKFPDEIKITSESVSAILICRVFHFFSGPQLEQALKECHRYLKVGGKLFIVGDSAYLRSFKDFHSLYESRKKSQMRWPGIIDDYPKYVPPHQATNLPDFFHALDPDILKSELEKTGFSVEVSKFFSQDRYPIEIRYDGREGVGIIANKI